MALAAATSRPQSAGVSARMVRPCICATPLPKAAVTTRCARSGARLSNAGETTTTEKKAPQPPLVSTTRACASGASAGAARRRASSADAVSGAAAAAAAVGCAAAPLLSRNDCTRGDTAPARRCSKAARNIAETTGGYVRAGICAYVPHGATPTGVESETRYFSPSTEPADE